VVELREKFAPNATATGSLRRRSVHRARSGGCRRRTRPRAS
jgi:hypothetical protein